MLDSVVYDWPGQRLSESVLTGRPEEVHTGNLSGFPSVGFHQDSVNTPQIQVRPARFFGVMPGSTRTG